MNLKVKCAGLRAAAPRHRSRRGAFSAALAAMAVAVTVLVNLLVSQLPETWTQFDLTDSGIYDITDTSRDYLASLDQEVVIHVLADQDALDTRIVRFLSRYEALSDRVSVAYTNPLVYPSVLSQYGVEDGTVVVTGSDSDRQESFSIDEIIPYDIMSYYYYGTQIETSFDAEALLTAAVDGVVSGVTRAAYLTQGHGETALPDGVAGRLEKLRLTLSQVNLLTDGGIPGDCALLILNGPEKDLADDELTLVEAYLARGGQVVYLPAGSLTALPNFEALCGAYGIHLSDGMIADPSRCYQNNPYLLFPLADTSVDAAQGLTGDATVLLYGCRGATLTDPARDGITVNSFLTTSDSGLSVTADGTKTQGTYALAAVATEPLDDGSTARLTVCAASLIDENLTAGFTNLDNVSLFLTAATLGVDGVSDLAIPSVSLETPTNTIANGGIWALLFLFLLPAGLLLTGFLRWLHRRKL